MSSSSLRQNPFAVALLLGLAAQLLFTIHLGRPSTLTFDEVHYVPAARHLLALDGPTNTEHPLLGKALIALGMLIYGDNAVGWRAFSSIAGTATIMGVFAITWLLFANIRAAVFAALYALLNITVYIQARIAMLDGFMTAFVVMGIAALLWAMRAPPDRVTGRWVTGSVLLGLAVGVKWAAVPYVAYAGLTFLLVRLRHRPDARVAQTEAAPAGAAPAPDHAAFGLWPGLGLVEGLALLGAVSIGVYFVTFLPAFFYGENWMTTGSLFSSQWDMFEQQRQVLPPHTYQSSWKTWPLMIRPIWYLYEVVDGAQRGILLLGNPAVLWGGLVAVAALLWAGIRQRSALLLAPALLWLGSYLVWAVIPKSLGFFYYYHLSTVFLPIALAAALAHYQGKRGWDGWFAVLCAALFVYFLPIISASALPEAQAFQRWMWFPTWP